MTISMTLNTLKSANARVATAAETLATENARRQLVLSEGAGIAKEVAELTLAIAEAKKLGTDPQLVEAATKELKGLQNHPSYQTFAAKAQADADAAKAAKDAEERRVFVENLGIRDWTRSGGNTRFGAVVGDGAVRVALINGHIEVVAIKGSPNNNRGAIFVGQKWPMSGLPGFLTWNKHFRRWMKNQHNTVVLTPTEAEAKAKADAEAKEQAKAAAKAAVSLEELAAAKAAHKAAKAENLAAEKRKAAEAKARRDAAKKAKSPSAPAKEKKKKG